MRKRIYHVCFSNTVLVPANGYDDDEVAQIREQLLASIENIMDGPPDTWLKRTDMVVEG